MNLKMGLSLASPRTRGGGFSPLAYHPHVWHDASDLRTLYSDGAALFNGGDPQSLRYPGAICDANGSFTVAGWLLGSGDIVTQGWDGIGGSSQFLIGSGTTEWISQAGYQSIGYANIPSGTWQFIELSYDKPNQLVSLRANGTVIYSVNSTITNSPGYFNFGAASGRRLSGAIDSWGVWSRLLTDSDREFLYNAGAGRVYADLTTGVKSGMVSWWDFSEGLGDRYDSHGTNNLASLSSVGLTGGIAKGLAYLADENVSVARDKSGNGRHLKQSSLSLRPFMNQEAMNGLNYLGFDGIDDILQTGANSVDSWGIDQPFDVYCVAARSTSIAGTGDKHLFDLGGTASLCLRAVYEQIHKFGNLALGPNIDAGNWYTGDFHLFSGFANGASSTARQDGVTISTGDIGAGNKLNGCAIAGALFSATGNTGIAFCELIITPPSSDDRRAKMESYLKSKWGL